MPNMTKTYWYDDYFTLFDEVIFPTLAKYDKSRVYWPSSPSNGFLEENFTTGVMKRDWSNTSN